LKFAGDAIFAEWRVEEGDHDHERSKPQKSSSKRTTQKSESSSALRKQSSEEEDKQTSRRRGKSPTKVRPIIINAFDASAGKGSTSGSTITPQIRVSTKSGSSTCAVKRPIPERRIVSRTSSMGAARRTDLTSRGCTTKDPIAARTATSSNERRRTIPVTTANPRPSNSRIKMSGNSSGSQSSSESSKSSASRLKMEDCVHAAAVCGAMIVNKCADYPIYEKSISGGQGPLVATLNIHCGIGAGKMAGIHVGNDSSCREYLVLGDPIDQVAEACDSAEMGEIRASRDALEYLNKGQEFKNQLRLEENTKSKTIASRKKMYFSKRRKAVWSLDGKIRKPLTPKERSFAIPFDDMSTTDLTAFHRLLSLYVHPVVLGDESSKAAVPSSRGGKNAQNRHRAEAELRSVCTIFIMPKITIKLTDDDKVNDKAFKQLDGIMNVVIDVLDSFKGHLRQYIVDDKGKFRSQEFREHRVHVYCFVALFLTMIFLIAQELF
jgi:class 3 adenylate cyclase